MKSITDKEFEAGYTIKMPKALFDQFIIHLESGKVKQGRGRLFDGEGYCCLGLLQATSNDGRCEVDCAGDFLMMPTIKQLYEDGIEFRDDYARVSCSPYFPSEEGCADEMNDEGYSFETIAKAFKKHTLTY